jgi:hypothetical protein
VRQLAWGRGSFARGESRRLVGRLGVSLSPAILFLT